MKIFLMMMMLAVGLGYTLALAQHPNAGATAGKARDQATEPGDVRPNDAADARSPDQDARQVDVIVTEGEIEMPTELESGKTAFVVKNNGNMTQTFEVRGAGIDRKLLTHRGETKVLHIELKSGVIYTVYSLKDDGEMRSKEITLHVK